MRMLLAWLRAYARRPVFPGTDEWTVDDAARLRQLLASPFGRRLSMTLTNAAIREAFRSTQLVKNADYDAGYAAGFRGTIAYVEALSACAPPQVDAPNSEETARQGAAESGMP